MYNILLWEKFYKTGLIEDYLQYVCSSKIEQNGKISNKVKRQDEQNAGLSDGDRYGVKSGTYRRV